MTPLDREMTVARLSERLAEACVPAPIAERVVSLSRAGVALQTRKKVTGQSYLGGVPKLPLGSPWPVWGERPLTFVGQIDLSEADLSEAEPTFPDSGVLSFFAAEFVGDDGEPEAHASVRYFSPEIRLMPFENPPGRQRKPVGLGFEARLMLPPYASTLVPWDEPYASIFDAAQAMPFHGLLTFDRPDENALGDGEVALLRLDASPDVPVDFVESAVLYFIVPAAPRSFAGISSARAKFGHAI